MNEVDSLPCTLTPVTFSLFPLPDFLIWINKNQNSKPRTSKPELDICTLGETLSVVGSHMSLTMGYHEPSDDLRVCET